MGKWSRDENQGRQAPNSSFRSDCPPLPLQIPYNRLPKKPGVQPLLTCLPALHLRVYRCLNKLPCYFLNLSALSLNSFIMKKNLKTLWEYQQGFSHGTVCPDLGSIPVSSHKNNLSLTEQHHIDFLTKKFQYCKQPDPTFGNNRIYFYP